MFSQLNSKSILITGAAGLIGSSFVDLLMELNRKEDADVNVLALGRNRAKLQARFPAYVSDPHFQIVEGDVTDCVLSDVKIDYIVHAASPAHPLAYSQTPVDVMKANLIGTINMLELARRSDARLLFISSGEIYGTSDVADSAFREGDYGYTEILNPRSCYPESKRAAETLCASYHSQYGVDAVIVRLCHVYGAAITDSNSRADAQFLRNAVNGEDIVMKSPGSQVRSFCYVKDAAMGLLYVLLKGTAGDAYNIANKNSVATIRQYAETLAELGGVKIRDEFPSEVESKGYSVISRAVLNASKLERLGWTPRFNLREGLKDTLDQLVER